MISGLITAVLFAAFVAITLWAWSTRNRERFREAARLALDEDAAGGRQAPACCRARDGETGR